LIVVKAASNFSDHFIGEAVLSSIHPEKSNWHFISTIPHTRGCLHAKLLLLRSAEGLRVAVCGGNLNQGQWENHRDVFWVQDFPLTEKKSNSKCNGKFGNDLKKFLDDMTMCTMREHQDLANIHLHKLLEKVDFSGARGKLVASFPREASSEGECGGWKQVCRRLSTKDVMFCRGRLPRDMLTMIKVGQCCQGVTLGSRNGALR